MTSFDEHMHSSDEDGDHLTPSEAGDDLGKIVFDRFGDLTLCVGPYLKPYQVCSRTVARASPVFRKMFEGNFVESRPSSGDWVINLPDDASGSMRLFLHITHGNFGSVPRTLNIPDLYSLVVLLDKYDALETIRPCAGAWIEGVSHDLRQPALLYIASELGDAQLFQKVLCAFAEAWIITESGELSYDECEFNTDPPPDGFEEWIWVPGEGAKLYFNGAKFPLSIINITLDEFDVMFTEARENLRKIEYDPYIELFEAVQRQEYAMSEDADPDQHIDPFRRHPNPAGQRPKDHFKCGANLSFSILLIFRMLERGFPTRDGFTAPESCDDISVKRWRVATHTINGCCNNTVGKQIEAEIATLECSTCREWAQQYLERSRESVMATGCITQDHLSYLAKRAEKTGLSVAEMKA